MTKVADEDGFQAQVDAVQYILNPERQLVCAAKRRAQHPAGARCRLGTRVPPRSRSHEQADLDAMFPPGIASGDRYSEGMAKLLDK